jgi:hypothetical protein
MYNHLTQAFLVPTHLLLVQDELIQDLSAG